MIAAKLTGSLVVSWRISLLFLVLPGNLYSDENNPVRQLEKRVVEHTLKNGMTVLILERTVAPIVSFQMLFRTGGVDEISGKKGLAHLFEHMMFKGSKTVGTKDYEKEKPILDAIDKIAREIMAEESKGDKADVEKINSLKKKMEKLEADHQEVTIPAEFDEIYQREGGEGLNAFTSQDMTGFVISLPANKWELWAILESERMSNPVLREFYKERDVVMEERRMRYENSPQGKLWENFISNAFMAHPYGSPTIGWMSDIKKLTLSDAEDFFKAHYAPNNAAIAIVGDVRPKDVIEKLERYFSKVPPQTLKGSVITEEPTQSGERRVTVHFDSEPSMMMGFHKPNAPHSDNSTMDMIEQIMSRGRTGRFYRNIIEKKIALSAWASNGNPGERYPNLMVFGGAPRSPNSNLDLENAIWKELEKLKKEKVPERDLQKIRNQVEADFIRELGSNSGMASQLVYYHVVQGDWRHLFKYLEGIRKVTADDIVRVAQTYFQRKNATSAFLEREKAVKSK